MISTELGISSLTANWLPIITQLGYAVGLLFIIPLGDLVQVRKILTVNFTLLAISLLATALTSNIYTLLFNFIYKLVQGRYASYFYSNGLTILNT